MTDLAIVKNKKAHTDDDMSLRELIASYPLATDILNDKQLASLQTVNSLLNTEQLDQPIYVNSDITTSHTASDTGSRSTANTIAVILYDENLYPSNLAFYPLDAHNNNGQPFLLHDDSRVSAFVFGTGAGEFIAADTQENAFYLIALIDFDFDNYTIIQPFNANYYAPTVRPFAKLRPITVTTNGSKDKHGRVNKEVHQNALKGCNVNLVETPYPLCDIGELDLTTWQQVKDFELTFITSLDNYETWHEYALLDKAVKYENGRFELYPDGLYFVRYEFDSDKSEYHKQYATKLCSPLHIKASIRNKDSTSWGVLMQWQDKDQHNHEWAMPLSLLQGDAREYRQILADLGLDIAPSRKARDLLTAYIQTYNSDRRALSVNKTGWHDDSYVLPHHIIGANPKEPIVLQTSTPIEHGYSTKGTLQQWRDNVAIPIAGQNRVAFALSCAFAGQLLHLLGERHGGGFHYWGASSMGKSITLAVAGSVWGNQMIKSWRSTDNALENIALLHNDSVLCLDEIGESDPRIVGKSIYMLANGQAKNRMTKTGVNKQAATWRVMVLSNGEYTIENYLRQAGETVKAGQEVRLCSIEANAGKNLGIFDSLTLADTSAKQAELLRENTDCYYGIAGITWLEYLTDNKDKVIAQAHELKRVFLADYTDLDGQAKRVANRFALVAVAGELASKAKITGWQQGQAIAAAKACFENWLSNYGSTGNHEQRQIIKQIQAFIHANGKSRFSEWKYDGHNSTLPNRVGFYRADDDCYYIYASLFEKEVCLPFNRKQVAETLDSLNLLNKNKGYQLNVNSSDRDKKGYFYCIKGAILELEP